MSRLTLYFILTITTYSIPAHAIEANKPAHVYSDADINQQIDIYENQRNYSAAIHLLTTFIKDNPNNEPAIFNMARLLIKNGDSIQAIALLAPLLKEHSNQWQPWFLTGTAWLQEGEFTKAAYHLDEALSRKGDLVSLWVQRAIIEHQKENYDSAANLLQIANQITPNQPEVLLNYAYALEKSNQLEKSLKLYKQFLLASASVNDYSSVRSKVLHRIRSFKKCSLSCQENSK